MSEQSIIMVLNSAIDKLRAELAERDAEIARLKEDVREWRNEHESVAQHLAATRVHLAEKPRTDAERKAADRRKRIFDKTIEAAILIHAARFAALDSAIYTGHVSAGSVPHRIGPMREASIAEAREIAAAVVEAEE